MKVTICTANQATVNSSEPVGQIGTAGPVVPTLVRKKELAKRLSVSPRFYLYDFEAVLASLRKQYQVESVSRA
jgi:hypothetical protein